LNKGVYKALDKAKSAAKRYRYVAKLDFRKYFDSISHDILKDKLERIFKDKRLLDIFSQIIDTYSVEEGKGIPIGNLTSQYFANYYLSSLDHYVKEELKVPVYIRYMDDMLLFDNDIRRLKECVNLVENYSCEKLHLTLKIPVVKQTEDTVSFLGYKIGKNVILLNSRSRNRFSKKMFRYEKLLSNGIWSEKEYQLHILPLLAFVQYAHTKKMRRRVLLRIKVEERL
ncbi:MAG: RNA-directed DNA polymerase, partial [Bacteroidales bacterium]|nr:RNA-directed DNA polymerase [Bacteroidales bacterium]